MRARINLTVTFLNLPSETVHDVVVRFVANLGAGCNASIEIQENGLCGMLASGPGRPSLHFSNLYRSIDRALRGADDFARYAVELLLSFGITPLLVNQSGLN